MINNDLRSKNGCYF